jgi:hypothetical protein
MGHRLNLLLSAMTTTGARRYKPKTQLKQHDDSITFPSTNNSPNFAASDVPKPGTPFSFPSREYVQPWYCRSRNSYAIGESPTIYSTIQ